MASTIPNCPTSRPLDPNIPRILEEYSLEIFSYSFIKFELILYDLFRFSITDRLKFPWDKLEPSTECRQDKNHATVSPHINKWDFEQTK